MRKMHCLVLLVACFTLLAVSDGRRMEHMSAVGDPGMRRDDLRVAFEAWNFCNEVGQEAPGYGSPRAADCFDVTGLLATTLKHRVSDEANNLGVGKAFPGLSPAALANVDLYAAEKERFLGSLCNVKDYPSPWQFWMVMLKNGNYDTKSNSCPRDGKKMKQYNDTRKFPCFVDECMNQPVLNHQRTELLEGGLMRGSFNGTYELDANLEGGATNVSFYEVVWEKKLGHGSWVFSHKLKTSKKYPWLMLYLRADAVRGFSGGYHYDTRGMLKALPESPFFKVKLTLDVKQGGGPNSQFYLVDIGSCWKNNGAPCDGDAETDVTRYCEMIINPQTKPWCRPTNLESCPPYHITPNNTKIHRNDTENFPYDAYHLYCAPGNAKHLEEPYNLCDPYSNPQPQELLQLLPHPIWAEYGYPTKQGDGWIGDKRTWELQVGELSSRLYFYQDPGTIPARRVWTSVDVGTEIYVSEEDEVAEWTLSDFDVLLR